MLTENRGDVPAHSLTKDDVILLSPSPFGAVTLDTGFAEFLGLMLGDGGLMGEQETAMVTLSPDEAPVAERVRNHLRLFKEEHAADGRASRSCEVNRPQGTLRIGTSARCVVDPLKALAVLNQGSKGKRFTDEVFF